MLQPYETENLVFIDTEFTSLDPTVGELLSIGMVKLTGESLYIELEHNSEHLSDWVAKHIIPTLVGETRSREDAVQEIVAFLGGTQPFAVAFVDNYDTIYLTKLFGHGNLPFRWMTIDFTSILFALGYNPVKLLADSSGAMALYRKLGIDLKKFRAHHALDDALLLREAWIRIMSPNNEVDGKLAPTH